MSGSAQVPGLAIFWREHLDVRYVTVIGEVDLSNIDALERPLASSHLHVDMSRVTFIDSVGLHLLVKARMASSEFHLIASRQVGRLLELAALLDILNVSLVDESGSDMSRSRPSVDDRVEIGPDR